MSALVTLFLCSPAHAASLDLLEVGGAYGTPGATNPTALWWNPAGLAVGGGKIQFLAEVAPTFAQVTAQRSSPDYGALTPQPGFPSSYDYGGTDTLKFNGVVPFLGVSSNLMVPGLGVGIGMAVPTARGGTSIQENGELEPWGANRYMIRDASLQAIHFIFGASYQVLNKISFGAALHYVDSSWYDNTDNSALPDLVKNAEGQGIPPTYGAFQDGFIEDRGYTTTLIFGGEHGNNEHGALKGHAITFGAGVYITPIGKKLGISLAYDAGTRLDHTGDLTMKFQCPPDYDALLLFGTQQAGLCNPDTNKGNTLNGTGSIGYNLPGRINMGVVLSPIEKVRLELMGSYVFWSAFTDYEIHTEIPQSEITGAVDDTNAASTAKLLKQDRLWARDTNDTFWIGADAKVHVTKHLLLGGRLMYDHHAIPDAAVSANNVDNDEVILGGLAEVDPISKLGIGLSFSHHFLADRTITDSAFAMTNDPAAAKPDRYFYPSANGTYGGYINRLGIVVHGHFGGQGW